MHSGSPNEKLKKGVDNNSEYDPGRFNGFVMLLYTRLCLQSHLNSISSRYT